MMKFNHVDFLGRGWAFPVTTTGGNVVFAQGEEDIQQSIILILSTGIGERVMLPQFGSKLKELVFAAQNTAIHALASYYVNESLTQWEPRIVVTNVSVETSAQQSNVLNISINYIVRATNVPNNLVYPFYLGNK